MKKTIPARRRGAWAECLAADYLRLAGLSILDANRRAEGGEIDLIAREQDVLVFVEVRLRDRSGWTTAGGSIDAVKRRRLRDCARRLARREDLRWARRTLRFDVVALRSEPGGLQLRHWRGVRI